MLLMACSKNNPKITRIVDLKDFHEVQINSPFEVYLQEDSTFFVEVVGHQKTVDAVKLDLSDGVLKISNELKGQFLKPNTNKATIIIHSKPLRLIQANETCHLSTVNPITSKDFGLIMKSKGNFGELELDSKVFYFWNNYPCGGKLTLKGQTEQLKIWSCAIISVDAQNLQTKYALVDNVSKGSCKVKVLEALEYNIRGEGNIEVYGNPPVVVKNGHSGEGQFILH